MIQPSELNDSSRGEIISSQAQVFSFIESVLSLGSIGHQQSYDERIPQPLQEILILQKAVVAARPGSFFGQHQDRLIDATQLDLSTERLIFLMENQGNWQCFINTDDEKLTVWCDDYATTATITAPLNELLITWALQETVWELTHRSEQNWTVAQLHSSFPRIIPIWIDHSYVPNNSHFSFFVLDRTVIFMQMNSQTFIASDDFSSFTNCCTTLSAPH
jgi:hypothetical protein